MDLKFIQDLHDKEFQTKDRLANRASTIVAGITSLSGVLAFIVVNFKALGESTDVIFWVVVVVSGIALAVTCFHLISSYQVPALEQIASPKEWLAYWNELKEKDKLKGSNSAQTEFAESLLNDYVETGDRNIAANFTRGTRLVKSNNALLASFVLVVITSLTFYFNNYILEKEIRLKGGNAMFNEKDALLCVPAAQGLHPTGEARPKPRPVPDPSPLPFPAKPRDPDLK